MFAGAVSRSPQNGGESRGAGDRDNRSFSPHQVRQCRLGAVHVSKKIHIHHFSQHRYRAVREIRPQCRARTVHKDIDAAISRDHSLHGPCAGSFLRYVTDDRECVDPPRPKRLRLFAQCILVHVQQGDPRMFPAEPFTDGRPDAAGGARHDDDPVFHPLPLFPANERDCRNDGMPILDDP